ncbi:hypothetical protein [Streptomyces sp. NPDC052225]|uniref:anti-sigma factor family protein n=1 Tax=Streptomyces sp. NPDC052225 TaxID=3154949 RepID=UPI0034346618
MTSTTDTAEHPEVTEISDLAEGLLPPSRTASLRRHLDGCPLCADVYASLEEIRGLLGTLPGPPRMPEDVAGRIDAALAAEALLDTLAPEAPVEAVRETAEPVSRETSADRAATATPRAVDRPTGHPHAATGPGRRARSARRRTGIAIGSVLTVAALGVGGLLLQNGGDTPTVNSPASGTVHTFAGAPVKTKVSDLLGVPSIGTESTGGPKSPQSSPKLKKGAPPVPACVQLGTRRNEDPIASERGTYDGKDAYLVVLPHRSEPTRVTAFVVDASCVTTGSSQGKLLYTHDYPRG